MRPAQIRPVAETVVVTQVMRAAAPVVVISTNVRRSQMIATTTRRVPTPWAHTPVRVTQGIQAAENLVAT
jgi:hypothetical protein